MSAHGHHLLLIDEASGVAPNVKKAVKMVMKTMVDGFARGQSVEEIVQLSGYDRATVEAVLRGAMRKQR